jgi:peptide deformylase
VKARPILIIGDPRLEEKCVEVSSPDIDLAGQLACLHATLDDFRRRSGFGRAMAAPQVGIGKRIVVMNLGAGPFALINPEITWQSDEEFEVWDDCLSIPDRVVRVKRRRSISVRYEDEARRGRHWVRLPSDLSELVQHEVDHLDGILMTQRAWGPDAVRPIAEHARLVGAARPKHRLSLDRIALAAKTIDPVFRQSPQYECESLSEALGCHLILKVEIANPIRSFKGRGASFLLNEALKRGDQRPVVSASAGNWGQALAYIARLQDRPVVIYASRDANPLKVARMRSFGAEVRLVEGDFDQSKAEAKRFAAATGAWMAEDGLEPEIAEGAGSIAVELLTERPALDAIVLPLGNGSLLTGNARWVKAASPATRMIGVCAAGADAMCRSFERGEPIETAEVHTIADGIAVRVPIPESIADMRGVVDEVHIVTDAQLIAAMRLVYGHTGLLIEPAGAAGVALILTHRDKFAGQQVATVLCGGNLTEQQTREWILPSVY